MKKIICGLIGILLCVPIYATADSNKALPNHVKKEIRTKCSTEFPSDFSKQASCIKEQVRGWHEINDFMNDEVSLKPSGGKSKTKPKAPQVIVQSKKKVLQTATHHQKKILNAAIFPWLLDNDANTFVSFLVDQIDYRIKDLGNVKLDQSYYKANRTSILDVSGPSGFYDKGQPNISKVNVVGDGQNIHVAILGKMDIHCKWSDECEVKQMEIMIIDTMTGKITSENGFSSGDARDFIAAIVSEAFRKFGRNMSAN